MCGEICSDNRFEIIEKAKQDLIESTNIESSKDEMKVLDSFLFRAWQMGWLRQYGETDWQKTEKKEKELSIDDVLNKFNEELKQMNTRLDELLGEE